MNFDSSDVETAVAPSGAAAAGTVAKDDQGRLQDGCDRSTGGSVEKKVKAKRVQRDQAISAMMSSLKAENEIQGLTAAAAGRAWNKPGLASRSR